MTTTEETRRLGDELERIDSEVDALAGALEDVDADTESGRVLRKQANELDTQGAAVAALIEEYSRDATVTVRGLTAGEYARVEDRVAAMREQSETPGGLPGSTRNVYAAAGLVDAPFHDGDDSLDAGLQTVTEQPIGVAKWLEAVVNDLTTVEEGNWTPLRERFGDTQED